MCATPDEQYDADDKESAQAPQLEAIGLDPGNATYHDDLGRVLYGQERYAEAEAAQRQLELDANSRPIQNRPTPSQTYLIATIGLAGSLVSAGLAITEIAEYAHHNRVGNLAILGMIVGALAGLTAAVANDEKPSGWAYRINIVAARLAGISFSCLLLFFLGQHGWMPEGG